MTMYEMIVNGIAIDGNSRQPMVILSDMSKQRALPIVIGLAEAAAISRALRESKSDRPMTHDLLSNIIDETGYQVDHVEINELNSQTFLATLCLLQKSSISTEFGSRAIDCRPSDGIAVAMLTGAPIMVSAEVFAAASIPLDIKRERADDQEFKRFVQELKPSDFARAMTGTPDAPCTSDDGTPTLDASPQPDNLKDEEIGFESTHDESTHNETETLTSFEDDSSTIDPAEH